MTSSRRNFEVDLRIRSRPSDADYATEGGVIMLSVIPGGTKPPLSTSFAVVIVAAGRLKALRLSQLAACSSVGNKRTIMHSSVEFRLLRRMPGLLDFSFMSALGSQSDLQLLRYGARKLRSPVCVA